TPWVVVTLGSNAPGFVATRETSQEVPPGPSTATGTATLTYNTATKKFDVTVTVTNFDPATVTGFHIHRGAIGVNGPIIVDFGGNTNLVPAGTGFTFNATGLTLPAVNEAALLGAHTST